MLNGGPGTEPGLTCYLSALLYIACLGRDVPRETLWGAPYDFCIDYPRVHIISKRGCGWDRRQRMGAGVGRIPETTRSGCGKLSPLT